MKKKGDIWKKFENLREDILIIINNSEITKTVNQIRRDLEKKSIKICWNTARRHLEILHEEKKIKKIEMGDETKFSYWAKK